MQLTPSGAEGWGCTRDTGCPKTKRGLWQADRKALAGESLICLVLYHTGCSAVAARVQTTHAESAGWSVGFV